MRHVQRLEERLVEIQEELVHARKTFRKTLTEVVAIDQATTGTSTEMASLKTSNLTIIGPFYSADEKDVVLQATLAWNQKDPRLNQLRKTRGRHGASEEHAMRWRRSVSTCVADDTKVAMQGWDDATCIAEFNAVCRLLDKPKAGAAGVQAKRTKLKRCVKDTEEEEEEEEEEALSVLPKRTKRERVIPDTDEEEEDKDAASVQVEELKFKKPPLDTDEDEDAEDTTGVQARPLKSTKIVKREVKTEDGDGKTMSMPPKQPKLTKYFKKNGEKVVIDLSD